MRLSLVTAVAALPVLVAAAPHPTERKIGMSIPITKRATFVNADKSVNFDALNSHVAAVQAKIARGFANYKKNTGYPHPAAAKEIHRRATGADALTDFNKTLWYGAISAGTPSKTFTVDFDTGSSDLFLPGPDCGSSCSGHTIYDPSTSSTSQDLGQTFNVTYANHDGANVSGGLFSDTISVAGLESTKQTLGVASHYSDDLSVSSFPADGFMGMAFQSISDFNAMPVFQNLVSQGRTDEPVFSFKLSDSGSELFLGGANSALYTGGFTYVPVTTQGYWQVKMDSVEAKGKTVLNNIDSIIDTGTTLIVGDPSQVESLYGVLGASSIGNGEYTFPCDSFPSVSFTFGGKSFPISAASLNVGPVTPGSSRCLSGIVGSDIGSSYWIIGDVFLRNVYTTFDVGNTRVGFATLA